MSAKANAIAAGVIAAVHATFPALVLLGAVHVSADTQAAVMVAITSYVTLVGLILAMFHFGTKAPTPVPPAGYAPFPAPEPRIAAVDPLRFPMAPGMNEAPAGATMPEPAATSSPVMPPGGTP